MSDSAGRVRPRPRPIPEILETAGRICLERPGDFYLVAAVALLVSWTVNLVIRVLTIGGVPMGALEDPRAPEFLHALAHLLGAGLADGMVYALGNSIAGAVLIVMVARRARPGPPLAEAVVLAAPRFWPAVLATLLFFFSMACLIGVGVTAAGLPWLAIAAVMSTGIAGDFVSLIIRLLASLTSLAVTAGFGLGVLYLWLRWTLYPQAVVLEGCGPMAALRRSVVLTRDDPALRWTERYLLRAALLTACIVLAQAVVGIVGSAPYGVALLLSQSGDLSRTSILNPTGMPLLVLIPVEIFSVLLRAAVYPFSVAVFVLLYEEVLVSSGSASGSIDPPVMPGSPRAPCR